MNSTHLDHARAGEPTAWMCGSEEFLECKRLVFASLTRKQGNRKVMRDRYAKVGEKKQPRTGGDINSHRALQKQCMKLHTLYSSILLATERPQ